MTFARLDLNWCVCQLSFPCSAVPLVCAAPTSLLPGGCIWFFLFDKPFCFAQNGKADQKAIPATVGPSLLI